MMNVFSDYAPKYHERGLCVIPVRGKAPVIKAWNKYTDAMPDEETFNTWMDDHADCGISLTLGPANGICGLDIDTDNPQVIDIIEKSLPQALVKKRGKKGYTGFYRFDFSTTSKTVIQIGRKGGDLVELLLRKHTVIPPSSHPDISGGYHWTTPYTLIDGVEIEDLPLITLADFERIRVQIAALGIVGDLPDVNPGRNTALGGYVSRLVASNTEFTDGISQLIDFDRRVHKSEALFEDPRENDGCVHGFVNAARFYMSHYQSFARGRLSEGKPVETPVSVLDTSSESAKAGFFMTVIDSEGKPTKVPDYFGFADWMISHRNVYSREAFVRIFDKTHYRDIGDREIRQTILKLTRQQTSTPTRINTFKATMEAKAFGLDSRLTPISGLINLQNGILDVQNMSLLEHTPDYNFRYVLDYDYDPEATCPEFLDFIGQTFNADLDTIILIRDFLAYTLIGGDPFLHKALCLIGSGRNGKSTLINAIKNVLGLANVAQVSMKRIGDPFSAVHLDGKLANLVEELPVDVIDPEVFKDVIAGGAIEMAHKHKDSYMTPVFARFIFATNDMPVFRDASAGLHERLVFVDFPNYIPDHKRRGDLGAVLRAETPGILNWALSALPMDSNFKLTLPESSTRLKGDFLQESNSVVSWFNDKMEIDMNYAYTVTTEELFDKYEFYCIWSKSKSVARNTFAKRMRELLRHRAMGLSLDENAFLIRRRNCRGFQHVKER